MMKAVISLFKRRKEIEREVEEELSLHVELLRSEHLRQGMSPEAANAATRKRFGDLTEIKRQCVAISHRSHPFERALKAFLVLMFLAGILVRFGSTEEVNFRHLSNLLMAVSVLGHLLLYARGLTPARFLSKSDTVPLSIFSDDSRMPITSYDEGKRTPIERVISDD